MNGFRVRGFAKDGAPVVMSAGMMVFDELVVGDWLHIEAMDDTCVFFRIGDAEAALTFNVILKDGEVSKVVIQDKDIEVVE